MHRRDRIRLDWLDTDNVQLYIFAICNCLNYFVGKWKLERQQKEPVLHMVSGRHGFIGIWRWQWKRWDFFLVLAAIRLLGVSVIFDIFFW